ncbi:MAG: von Willebrand factor type family protein [Actinomycetia bacterium]|nr:von Willebrand factor type family protein [Actinomycetes bacterium]
MRRLWAGSTALLLLVVAGCTDSGSSGNKPTAGVLRVLAGSELADLKPILDQAKNDIGVTVKLDYAGTLDGVQQVIDGKTDGRYEAIWFSSNRYLALHPEAQSKIGGSVKTMASPVVLGLTASVAKRLGWDRIQPTWAQIAAAAGDRKFTYGMTSPAASNSGFSALVAVASALAGAGSALDTAAIDKAVPKLKSFFAGQTLTAGSSGWLSDSYVRRATQDRENPIDGLVNYESVLLSLNASGRLAEPLTLIYPSDGVITADYPLTLLRSAPANAGDGFRKLTEYLRRPEVQRRIMTQVYRRPVVPGVQPDVTRFPAAPPELPFPARLDAADALIGAFYDRLRRPARTIYVLDVSGSMEGDRIDGLRRALTGLTGADNSLTGRFQRFHNRESVTLIPFSSEPKQAQSYTIPDQGPEAELGKIRSFAQSLSSGGGTAIYDTLQQAFDATKREAAQNEGKFTSIVLMTDGENTSGSNFAAFRARYPSLQQGVPIFPILFGEGRTEEMNGLAQLTGGRTFDARSQSLAAVFREIRGYQ